ncbi:hypothetical protein J3L18_25965 [Mucilaginibacter gossypii]|uniref:hypothetical protein n=1 Tax=Mucilaginibacter gossypii TaxID=551996 RepID=UPI000DCBB366|nr:MULTISPECIES: hypothetical protein [Mucilaginibacter]QTE36537.1 hypothetical protein J3L18_25965 [Mucilaginibacter gossypii]RAV47385.1 hypothetical protein DIU36_29750 [Mucilaginibacter rubeus]
MAKSKIKPNQKKSIIAEAIEKKKSVSDLVDNGLFKISFEHFDREQGQRFEEWQESKMLGEALNTLWNYCFQPLFKQYSDKFTVYGDFPPSNKTEFSHPKQVPQDAKWARIHVNGLHCLIGHVIYDTFYLVFLDQEHKFWISELKNT